MDREIAKFYEELFRDANVKQKLANKMKEISSEEELRKLIEEEIVPAAQKMGKDFAVEDLINFEKESLKIAESELKNISGGVSLKTAVLGGGLLAMSFLGVKVDTADAVIPVSNTTNYDLSESKEVVAKNGTEEKGKNGTSSQNEGDVKQEKNESDSMNAVINSELGNDQSKTDVSKSAQYNTGEKYIWTALNPRYALIMNLSGATENFRFFNEYIKMIKFGDEKNPGLKYNQFSGEGSANLMTSLFPSSAGLLETGGGVDEMHPLSKCTPSPELMAEIVACLHNNVRTTPKTGKIKFNDIPNLSNNNEFEKIKKLIKDNNNDIDSYIETLKEIRRQYAKSKDIINAKTNNEDFFNKLNEIGFEINTEWNGLENAFKFLQDVSKIKKLDLDLNLIKDVQSFQTVRYVLKNAQHMIEKQEQADEQDKKLTNEQNKNKNKKQATEQEKERTLPKYTTERMLMCYFLNQFNSEADLKAFYDTVRKNIKGHTSALDEEEFKKIKEQDESIKKVLSKIHVVENCPYKNELAANMSAKKIIKNKEEKLQFITSGFADCADITVGHFMNLMGYNDTDKWNFFLSDTNETKLDTDMNAILNAIKKDGVLPNLTLKEKLQAFIHHISQVGADNSSVETRSFWNAVVSNMDAPKTDAGLYAIRYANKEAGNEVDTGFVNMLKVTYNLLHELGKDCSEAKTAIDKLDAATKTNIKNEDKNELLKTAMESVVHIFDKHAEVNIHNTDEKNNDIYGKINISSNKKTFKISQSTGHAFIDFNPLKTKPLNANNDADILKLLKTDPVAQLLSHFFDIEYEENAIPFNKYYAKKAGAINDNSQHYANVSALKFLKAVQGEDENIRRIIDEINKNCMETDINIIYQGDKSKKEKLRDYILKNYALKSVSTLEKSFGDNYNLKNSQLYNFAKDHKLIATVNNIEYFCVDNGNGDDVSILPFWGEESCPEEFVIPSTVKIGGKDKQVSGLLAGAFYKNEKIKTVKFSDDFNNTTLNIGDQAFENSPIDNFIIPKSVEKLIIGEGAFSVCENLMSFTISEKVSDLNVRKDAFFNCKKLRSFKMPEGIKNLNIGYLAFGLCDRFRNFTIPKSVETLHIGNAFTSDTHCKIPSKFKEDPGINDLNLDRVQLHFDNLSYPKFRRVFNSASNQANHLLNYMREHFLIDFETTKYLIENLDDFKDDIEYIAKQIVYKDTKEHVIAKDGTMSDILRSQLLEGMDVEPEFLRSRPIMLSGNFKDYMGVNGLSWILELYCGFNN